MRGHYEDAKESRVKQSFKQRFKNQVPRFKNQDSRIIKIKTQDSRIKRILNQDKYEKVF